MAAEVSDLSCDSQEASPGLGWRQIREWFHDFVADYFNDENPNTGQRQKSRQDYNIPGHPPMLGAPEVTNSVAAQSLAPLSEVLPRGSLRV